MYMLNNLHVQHNRSLANIFSLMNLIIQRTLKYHLTSLIATYCLLYIELQSSIYIVCTSIYLLSVDFHPSLLPLSTIVTTSPSKQQLRCRGRLRTCTPQSAGYVQQGAWHSTPCTPHRKRKIQMPMEREISLECQREIRCYRYFRYL